MEEGCARFPGMAFDGHVSGSEKSASGTELAGDVANHMRVHGI